MDSDEIDIGRQTTITLPDGSETIVDDVTPMYTNIKCHLSFGSVDNPDPSTVGANPIITSLTINCPISTDLRESDRIWARKLDAAGNVLESYTGMCGAPQTNQSRKTAIISGFKAVAEE
ncbi:hypothetical protein QE152_g39996 [Popillia japonica]|uniref:Uncharacterized protein n=1 Tax=Popillia japonica TaxID=7064 RepID=A0AAW1HSN5_POPJA